MPFIYDETDIEWPDDDDYEPPPRADQFFYLSPPEFGGAPEPVRFSVAEPRQAAEPAPAPGEPPRSVEESRRQREKSQEERRQLAFAFAVPELRKAGVRRVHCRYDGGHDEGFSRLDRAEMAGGPRLDADAPMLLAKLSYTLVEINADDTETDVATELARTEVEALMVFGRAMRLAANWSPAISRIVQSFI